MVSAMTKPEFDIFENQNYRSDYALTQTDQCDCFYLHAFKANIVNFDLLQAHFLVPLVVSKAERSRASLIVTQI